MAHYGEIPLAQLQAIEKSAELACLTDPARIRAALSRSGLFDRMYYETMYKDVKAAGVDALTHYVASGWREGRNPNIWFDSRFYVEDNPLIAADIANPLLHYIHAGFHENRRPNSDIAKMRERLVLVIMAGRSTLGDTARFLRRLAAAPVEPDVIIVHICQPDAQEYFNQAALYELLHCNIQIRPYRIGCATESIFAIMTDYAADVLALVNPNAALPQDWLRHLRAAWGAAPGHIHASAYAWAVLQGGSMDIARANPGGQSRSFAIPLCSYGVLIPPGVTANLLQRRQQYSKYAPDYPDIWLFMQNMLQNEASSAEAALLPAQPGVDKVDEPAYRTQLEDMMLCFRRDISRLYGFNVLEELFKSGVAREYERRMKQPLNWDRLATFGEKIQYLKIYGDDPLKTICADKYNARRYIERVAGHEYLVPLLGVWKNVNDINFDLLPNKFVLKTTHGSGQVIIVNDKQKLDIDAARAKLARWQAGKFWRAAYEFNYFDIEPLIVCEELLGDNISDYKVLCFHGNPESLWVATDRFKDIKFTFYSLEWKKIDVFYQHKPESRIVARPVNFEQMIELSRKLSAPFDHARIDFYILDDNSIKVGELTFSSSAGYERFWPHAYDVHMGSLFDAR